MQEQFIHSQWYSEQVKDWHKPNSLYLLNSQMTRKHTENVADRCWTQRATLSLSPPHPSPSKPRNNKRDSPGKRSMIFLIPNQIQHDCPQQLERQDQASAGIYIQCSGCQLQSPTQYTRKSNTPSRQSAYEQNQLPWASHDGSHDTVLYHSPQKLLKRHVPQSAQVTNY